MTSKKTITEELKKCPWCGRDNFKIWGIPVRGFKSVKCRNCGLIFVKNRLNQNGLANYYKKYFSKVHQVDDVLNIQRQQMYQLEFELVNRFSKKGKVLDVGCSGGYFLDVFKNHGYKCYGVEVGEEAAEEAGKKYPMYFGNFSKLKIKETFDLIIFRGVIEHVPFPKKYLKKAIEMLNKNGLIYITSTPNADAFCVDIFKEEWNQHEPEAHLMHFSPKHFDDYFLKKGLSKLEEYYFYQETPYANPREDTLKVAQAVQLIKEGEKVIFRSPPFWENMMSLIYKK